VYGWLGRLKHVSYCRMLGGSVTADGVPPSEGWPHHSLAWPWLSMHPWLSLSRVLELPMAGCLLQCDHFMHPWHTCADSWF
jgi:hypothetical protein